MKVSECMTRRPDVVMPDQPIREAATFMLRDNAGSMPVCDGDRLVGMITDRDIAVRTVAAGRGPDTPVREAMTDHVDYGFDDEEVEAVAIKMSDAQVRRLPVISRDEKKLVGIVSPAISAAPTKARRRASRWAASPIPVGSTTSRPSSAERPMAERRRARDVCGGEIVLRRPWQRPVFGAGLAAFTVLGAILAVG